MTRNDIIPILRQAVQEQRAVKQAAMQKRAFTLAELGVVGVPTLAALGYGAYKTRQRAQSNPVAGARSRTGSVIGGVTGAALPAVLSLLSRGRLKKPSLVGSAITGLLGSATGSAIGTWTAPNSAQQK